MPHPDPRVAELIEAAETLIANLSERHLYRDEVNELEACIKRAADPTLELTASAMRADVDAQLLEALKPFADEASTWNHYFPDAERPLIAALGDPACESCGGHDIQDLTDAAFSVGDLRRAAEVYSKFSPTTKEG